MTQRNQKQTSFIPRGSPHALNDLIEQRPREQQLLEQLERANARLGVLEIVNSRLGQKLLEFQLQLGISPDDITKELEALDEFPLGSMVDPNILPYLESLFTAYDDSNLKQKKLIGRLYSQLNDLEKRTEIIVRDNSFLMQELQGKCKVILQIYDNGFPEEHLAGIYLKLQKEDLELKQSTLMDQNEYLSYNFRSIESKYHQTNKELQSTRIQLQDYFENYKVQAEKLKSVQVGSTEIESKFTYLMKQYQKITSENATFQARCGEFQHKIVSLNNQLSLMRKQNQNEKRRFREDEDKLKQQLNTLQQRLQEVQSKQRNQFNQLITFQKQIEVQKDNAKKYKRENQQNKRTLEETFKMLGEYETKLTNQININENKEKVRNMEKEEIQVALLERDKAVLRQQQLEKQLEANIARNKEDLQTLKESYEKIIRTQGERTGSIEESLEQSEIDKQGLESTMKSLSERHRRELGQMREETERLSKQLRMTNCEELINKAREGEERAESLKRVLENNEKSHRDDMEDKMDIIRRLEAQNRETTRLIDKERAAVRELTSQRNSLKGSNTKLTKELNILTDEIESKRRGVDAKLVVLQSEQQNKVREIEERLNERLGKEREARQRAVQKLETYEELEKELKKEFESRVRQLESENQVLKEKLLAKRK